MKIIRLTAENVKKISVVDITPKGSIVQISGKNGSGKSSVLDAIMWVLAGKNAIPPDPIRHGEVRATIKLDMGELVVTRVITEGKNELHVKNSLGGHISSPQKVLDALLGSLTFDPLEFTRLKAKDQLEKLLKLVPLEIDLVAVDAKIAKVRDERLELGRDIKGMKSHVEGFPSFPDDLPLEKVSAVSLAEEIGKVHAHNAEVKRIQSLYDRRTSKLAELDEDIARLEVKLGDLRAERLKVEAYVLGDIPVVVEVSHFIERMSSIELINAQIEKRGERDKMRSKLAAYEDDYSKIGDEISKLENSKSDAMAKADMPVPGLGFGEGMLTFNGVPLEQASTAEQLRVSVAIAMAMNPTLRVLRIMEGSLLDEDSLAMIGKMAEERDYQVWVECVDSTGLVGIVMSEGVIVADNQGGQLEEGHDYRPASAVVKQVETPYLAERLMPRPVFSEPVVPTPLAVAADAAALALYKAEHPAALPPEEDNEIPF